VVLSSAGGDICKVVLMTDVADGFVVMADAPVTAAQATAAASAMTATAVRPATIARVILFVIDGRRWHDPAASVAIVGCDSRLSISSSVGVFNRYTIRVDAELQQDRNNVDSAV